MNDEQEEQARECKRNGHRDTGRGVCANCGEFLDIDYEGYVYDD